MDGLIQILGIDPGHIYKIQAILGFGGQHFISCREGIIRNVRTVREDKVVAHCVLGSKQHRTAVVFQSIHCSGQCRGRNLSRHSRLLVLNTGICVVIRIAHEVGLRLCTVDKHRPNKIFRRLIELIITQNIACILTDRVCIGFFYRISNEQGKGNRFGHLCSCQLHREYIVSGFVIQRFRIKQDGFVCNGYLYTGTGNFTFINRYSEVHIQIVAKGHTPPFQNCRPHRIHCTAKVCVEGEVFLEEIITQRQSCR